MKKRKTPRAKRAALAGELLRIERAKVRALKSVKVTIDGGGATHFERKLGEPARFVQCWPVQRGGYSAVTQALDEDGQVWERVTLMGPEEVVEGKKVKRVQESYWIRISMTRKDSEG